MNNSVYEGAHAPCGYLGVLGCGGYKNTDQIICLTATGDNNFLSDGIVEGTIHVDRTRREIIRFSIIITID